eukprot:scaffold58_cov256-Pinguiococcus_pyrenoidosus.AAC.24
MPVGCPERVVGAHDVAQVLEQPDRVPNLPERLEHLRLHVLVLQEGLQLAFEEAVAHADPVDELGELARWQAVLESIHVRLDGVQEVVHVAHDLLNQQRQLHVTKQRDEGLQVLPADELREQLAAIPVRLGALVTKLHPRLTLRGRGVLHGLEHGRAPDEALREHVVARVGEQVVHKAGEHMHRNATLEGKRRHRLVGLGEDGVEGIQLEVLREQLVRVTDDPQSLVELVHARHVAGLEALDARFDVLVDHVVHVLGDQCVQVDAPPQQLDVPLRHGDAVPLLRLEVGVALAELLQLHFEASLHEGYRRLILEVLQHLVRDEEDHLIEHQVYLRFNLVVHIREREALVVEALEDLHILVAEVPGAEEAATLPRFAPLVVQGSDHRSQEVELRVGGTHDASWVGHAVLRLLVVVALHDAVQPVPREAPDLQHLLEDRAALLVCALQHGSHAAVNELLHLRVDVEAQQRSQLVLRLVHHRGQRLDEGNHVHHDAQLVAVVVVSHGALILAPLLAELLDELLDLIHGKHDTKLLAELGVRHRVLQLPAGRLHNHARPSHQVSEARHDQPSGPAGVLHRARVGRLAEAEAVHLVHGEGELCDEIVIVDAHTGPQGAEVVRFHGLPLLGAGPLGHHLGVPVLAPHEDDQGVGGHVTVEGHDRVPLDHLLHILEAEVLDLEARSEHVVSAVGSIPIHQLEDVWNRAHEAIALVRREVPLLALILHGQQIDALEEHLFEDVFVARDALHLLPQREEDELLRRGGVGEEHAKLRDFLAEHVAILKVGPKRLYGPLVSREVVLNGRLHVLQVVQLLQQIDDLDQRVVQPLRHDLRTCVRSHEVLKIRAEDVDHVILEVHQLFDLDDFRPQQLEGRLVHLLLVGRIGVGDHWNRPGDRAEGVEHVHEVLALLDDALNLRGGVHLLAKAAGEAGVICKRHRVGAGREFQLDAFRRELHIRHVIRQGEVHELVHAWLIHIRILQERHAAQFTCGFHTGLLPMRAAPQASTTAPSPTSHAPWTTTTWSWRDLGKHEATPSRGTAASPRCETAVRNRLQPLSRRAGRKPRFQLRPLLSYLSRRQTTKAVAARGGVHQCTRGRDCDSLRAFGIGSL